MKLQKPIIFQYVVTAKVDLMALFFSTRVVYNKTIIIILSFTPVSMKALDISLTASGLGKYPPLIISTSLNNYIAKWFTIVGINIFSWTSLRLISAQAAHWVLGEGWDELLEVPRVKNKNCFSIVITMEDIDDIEK